MEVFYSVLNRQPTAAAAVDHTHTHTYILLALFAVFTLYTTRVVCCACTRRVGRYRNHYTRPNDGDGNERDDGDVGTLPH